MKPKLIVTTGFPSCGKSTYSKYLVDEHGFYRLSTDDLREKLWGCGFMDYEYQNPQNACKRKEHILGNVIQAVKYERLFEGNNVVIDATCSTDVHRSYFFSTYNGKDELPVDRILLYIRASKEELDKRNAARGRTEVWTPDYQEPKVNDYYNLVTFDNNNEIQKAKNIKKLDEMIRSYQRK